MKNETKEAFLKFNPQLQKELIALHPELEAVLDENSKKKYFANWSSKNKASNYIKRDWKERILSCLDLKKVMECYGVAFNRNGFAHCPFHNEKTASLSIKDNHYKCFGCGRYGNVIDFAMEYFSISFKDAMVKLDHDFNLGITGAVLTFEEQHQQKKIAEEHEKLKSEHQEFRQYYMEQTDIYRYLQKAIVKYRPMDSDQPADDWHPVFIYAAQNLNILEHWLDRYIHVYSDIRAYQETRQEGRLYDWVK